MNFSFVENVKVSAPVLEPNKIHSVVFNGCEARTIESAKGKYDVLDIKFSNADGQFTDTVFDPGEDVDTDGMFGKNPSNVKALAVKVKHLLDAVCPENSPKVSQLQGSWLEIRNQIIELTAPGIGKETKIKLLGRERADQMGNKSIYPEFPGFFAKYDRNGNLYLATNFIGNSVYFKSSELTKIKNMQTATPTPMGSEESGSKTVDYDF